MDKYGHKVHREGDIALADFAIINMLRCTQPDGFGHNLFEWSLLEWAGAMCGEAGEAANVAKKLKRIDSGLVKMNKVEDRNTDSLTREFVEECADTIFYAFLAIQAAGYNPEQVLRDVFNSKSEKANIPYVI